MSLKTFSPDWISDVFSIYSPHSPPHGEAVFIVKYFLERGPTCDDQIMPQPELSVKEKYILESGELLFIAKLFKGDAQIDVPERPV